MYKGYLIKFNNLSLPMVTINGRTFNTFVLGSYQVLPSGKQEVGSWTDANGKSVVSYFPHKRTKITFSIEQRTAEQHASLSDLWNFPPEQEVEYWDDVTASYKTGIFRMANVTFNHSFDDANNMYYADTQVTLEEV